MTSATGCLASSRLAAQVIGGVEHLSKSKPPPTRWHCANGRDDREQRPKDQEASPRQRLRQPPATTASAGYCCSVYLVRLSRKIVLHSCSELTSKHLKSPRVVRGPVQEKLIMYITPKNHHAVLGACHPPGQDLRKSCGTRRLPYQGQGLRTEKL